MRFLSSDVNMTFILTTLSDELLDADEKRAVLLEEPDLDIDADEIERLLYDAYHYAEIKLFGKRYRLQHLAA